MNSEETPAGAASATEALGALHDSMRECSDCGLSAERTQVVFGVGSPDAELMFVGEGPGFHEDKQGEPFVGQAGRLLTELLAGIGLARADVYIANVVKCRPPENRDPAIDEIEACSPHLLEQIAIIRPKIICTLGRFATKLLGETELSMTAVHGKAKERTLAGVQTVIFPVFHPAAALYAPTNKKVLEEDFGRLRALLSRGGQVLTPAVAAGGAGGETDSVPEPERKGVAPGLTGPAPERTRQLHLW
jgi:uracil-DNA glycosylase family 4